MTPSQTRAAILEKTIEKFKAAGIPIDIDPILHGWLAAWVDGGLKMSDIAQRYQNLLKARLVPHEEMLALDTNADQLSLEENHKLMDEHELLAQVARLLADVP